MLEALLNHFRSYGMNDLEFIIVNSKLSHAQLRLEELEKRVSFRVYQETDEEEVWSVMEGGKDDMFIYDRCGRLTYFVPFPLSILNEYPLVSNAILATYFRSPCGVTCEKNGTVEIGEIAKNIENNTENEFAVTQDEVFYNETEGPAFDVNASEDYSSNYLLDIVNSEMNVTALNLTDSVTVTEYDYLLVNDTVDKNITNSTIANESRHIDDYYMFLFRNRPKFNTDKAYEINSTFKETALNFTDSATVTDNDYLLVNDTVHKNVTNSTIANESKHIDAYYKFLFRNRPNTDKTYEINSTFKETVKNDTFLQSENNNVGSIVQLHNHQHHKSDQANRQPKKSERCVEADYDVCKSWSKKRLLHAQKCCSSGPQTEFEDGTQRSCHHFGKKRCKKIHSILKCCIKTSITEASTIPESDATTEPNATADPTSKHTDVAGVVCCMISDAGKFCRVSETGMCKEGESVEDPPNQRK